MGWIKGRHGRLRHAGRISRPDTFVRWLEFQGRPLVEHLASLRRFSLFGPEWATKRQLWKELKSAAECVAVASAIDAELERFVLRPGDLAEHRISLPRGAAGLRRLVVVPRALCNLEALEEVERRLNAIPDLTALKGGSLLLDYFYLELVRQADAALSRLAPTPYRPVPSSHEWVIVGVNLTFTWLVPLRTGLDWRGHYFLYEAPRGRVNRSTKRAILRGCEELQRALLGLSREQLVDIVRAARVLPVAI